MNARDLEFLYEIGTLRNIERGWRQHLGEGVATDPEHSFRVAFIAHLLAKEEGADMQKVMLMALVHDLAETRTGDMSYMQRIYTKTDEHRAAADMLEGTSFRETVGALMEEYEKRETLEAKIVKDADNMDIDLELKELEERGSLMPKKWEETRLIVRNQKLHTQSAKRLWDMIRTSDVSSWHLKSNKWYKLPDTGR